MKQRKKYKLLYGLLVIFSFYVIIILSDMALPIVYHYLMSIVFLLAPFIAGFFIAFLLHTLVDKIEAQGINRFLSVMMVFTAFILLVVYLISSLIPIIFSQINELEEQIPKIYQSLESFFDNLWNRFDFVPEKYQIGMDEIKNWTLDNLINFNLSSKHMSNLFESFNIIVLTPIIIYYFLYDYNNLKLRLKKILEKHHFKFAYHFLKEADEGIGAYFRGLILVMNLMTLVSTLGFYLIGLPYPLLFGFIVGYADAIPIIGNYIGGAPAVIFGLTRSWKLAILALVVIYLVQTIEANIVTPYIQSKSIDCHPLLILLAFVVFGKYFGLLGMIFAIPLLAIILLLIKYIKIYYRIKRLRIKKQLLDNTS